MRIRRIHILGIPMVVVLVMVAVEIGLRMVGAMSWSRQIAKSKSSSMVVIGDSFVASGNSPGGWNDPEWCLALGIPGGCPSQYWKVYQKVIKQCKPDTRIVVVTYLGNDVADEWIWERCAGNNNKYMRQRLDYYRNHFGWHGGSKAGLWSWMKRNLSICHSLAALHWKMSGKMAEAMEPNDNLLFDNHKRTLASMFPHTSEKVVELYSIMSSRALIVPILSREDVLIMGHSNRPVLNEIVYRCNGIDINGVWKRGDWIGDGHWSIQGHRKFRDALQGAMR